MSQFTTSTMKTSASELKEPENVILRNQIEIEEIMKKMNELKRKYPDIYVWWQNATQPSPPWSSFIETQTQQEALIYFF